jgi:hypothetical protein
MLTRERQGELRATIFQHLDGIVTAPTIHALEERGVLSALRDDGVVHLEALSERFDANDGYLNVALRVLASQGWLEQKIEGPAERIAFALTDSGRIAFDNVHLYRDVVEFMHYSGGFHPRRFELEPFLMMEAVYARYRDRYGVTPPDDAERDGHQRAATGSRR